MKKNTFYMSIYAALLLSANGQLSAGPSANQPLSISGNIQPGSMQSMKKSKQGIVKTLANGNTYREGEVIIKYKNKIDLNRASSIVGAFNIFEIKEFKTLSNSLSKTYILLKSKTLSTDELMEEYKNDPDVEYVEPNYIYYPSKTPNDPKFNLLWGQHNTGQSVKGTTGTPDKDMDAPEAWNKDTGSNSVVVAVIDTGVDYLHEDLKANMWKNPHEVAGNGIDDDHNGYIDDVYGINSVDDNGDPMDIIAEHGGHGTHVAGTIAAVGDNGKGVVGVSWKSKIMALRFLGKNGGASSDAVQCLEYVLAQKKAGVNIVATNNSWGGPGASEATKDAIKATNDAGIIFIAAAGNENNDNDNEPSYPASYDLPGIVAVAATDQDDSLASFSNYGATSVDMSAPGVNILSTTPRGYTPGLGDIFFDDFESGGVLWSSGADSGIPWGVTDDQEIFAFPDYPVPSPTHFLSDSPGENYASNTLSYVQMKVPVDLSSYKNQRVDFAFGAAYAIQANDFGQVLVTPDDGVNWYLADEFTAEGLPWLMDYDYIIPEEFKTEGFRLAFLLYSDGSSEHAGLLIDNVGIGTNILNTYGYKNGTSMAAPQVSGAVALIASICGAETVSQLKERLLNNVDMVANLEGKVLTSGRLNVYNAVTSCGTPVPKISMSSIYYLLGM